MLTNVCVKGITVQHHKKRFQIGKSVNREIFLKHFTICQTNFTLFNFSGDNQTIKKFKAYGQFLIVAKNQN